MDKHNPLVSIVAVCYNHSKFVTETLDSIIHQTYENIELIIIDAFSTDNSVEVIEQWVSRQARQVVFVKQSALHTVCENFNMGVKRISGQYFQCMSCDDVIQPDKIEKQVEVLEQNSNVGMVFSNALIVDEHSRETGELYIAKEVCVNFEHSDDIKKRIFRANYVPAPSVLMRAELLTTIGYYDENLAYEDWDYWLRLAGSGWDVMYLNHSYAKYRRLGNSLWAQKNSRMLISTFSIFRKHGLLNRSNGIIAFYNYYYRISPVERLRFYMFLFLRLEIRQLLVYSYHALFRGRPQMVRSFYKLLYQV